MREITIQVNELPAAEIAELKDRLEHVEFQSDMETLQPYKELDGRRYYFEDRAPV